MAAFLSIISFTIHAVKINKMDNRTHITTDAIQWVLIDCIIKYRTYKCCYVASEIELRE